MPVTIDNLQNYIDLSLHFFFEETIKMQIKAFKKGFNSIFSIDTLKSFDSQNEIDLLVCGIDCSKNDDEFTNIALLSEIIETNHGYTMQS
mmetsp:Transcript_84127/g.116235  ORF Transcript_84127/g.116235 Transcript_84127/m.116235 type:complete len:90 (-) Transcript_84127:394-663(-)